MRIMIIILLMLSASAVSAFGAASETPQTPDDLVRQGWRLLDRGLNVEALKVFQEAMKAAPDAINVDAHRGYQDAMIALGKKDELLDEYQKMTEEKPDSAAVCYLYSRLLDDPDEEKDWLEKAKALDDKFPYTYYGLSLQESDAGDKESAEKDLRRAIELKPDFAHAYRALGMLYVGAGKPDDAEKLYLEAAKNLPKEAFPHSYLCDIYELKGNYDSALEQINAAIALADDRPDFYVRKAEILVAKGDKAEAINTLRKICELEPTLFEARDAYKIAADMTTPKLGFEDPAYDTALKEISDGNTESAIARLTKLAEEKGDAPLVYYQLGRAFEVQGRKENGAGLEKAVEYYDKAAKAAPEFADAFYGLASVQYTLAGLLAADKANSEKLLALSEKMALHVLTLNPVHSDANLLLAKICHGRGEFEKALQYAASCYKIAQDYQQVRPILIDVVRLKGAEDKPEMEFQVDPYSVKVYPVPNVPGNVGGITRRFDVYKGDALYKQFFEEVLTDTNEGTGELVTKYYLCELLNKDNNTTDILLPAEEEPTVETYQEALKNALNPQPPGE